MPFVFPRDALFLIAGPCVLESDELNVRVGDHLARLADHCVARIVERHDKFALAGCGQLVHRRRH